MTGVGPTVGGVFAGYEVLSQLGKGGMGTVYLVRNPNLGRQEALKVLDVHTEGDFAARFAAEARTVASLDHPGIVTVYHHGIDGERPWFTMQYLPGTDLTGAGPLPVAEVVEIVGRVAAALDYAHARGVVHRDIKPANIQVSRDSSGGIERVTVLDFGIARLAGSTSMTAVDTFVGTLTYAAPETIRGQRDVAAADQYSLACTAYELLTGQPPFAGLTAATLMHAQLNQAPPPISSLAPGLGALDPVFARAFAKDPAHRFPSCRDFAAALAAPGAPVAPAAMATPAALQRTAVAPVGPRFSGPHTPPPVNPGSQPARPGTSKTTVVLAALAIVIGLGVIIGAIVVAGRDGGTPEAGPESAALQSPELQSSALPSALPADPSVSDPPTSETGAVPAEITQVWGLVVSPQGDVYRFKNYESKDALLERAASKYGYTDSWGYATFTTGCGAVAGATSGSGGYYTARGTTRTDAESEAVSRARSGTGEVSRVVDSLCVGDQL